MSGVIYRPKKSLIKYGKMFGGGMSEEDYADAYTKYYNNKIARGEHDILDPDEWERYYKKIQTHKEEKKEYARKFKAMKNAGTSNDPNYEPEEEDLTGDTMSSADISEGEPYNFFEQFSEDEPVEFSYEQPEFYYEPKNYSDSDTEEEHSEKEYSEDEGLIPDKQGDITIYRKSIPKRGRLTLPSTSTSTMQRDYPSDTININLSEEEEDEPPEKYFKPIGKKRRGINLGDTSTSYKAPENTDDYSMFTRGPTESTIEQYNAPINDIVAVDDEPNYEFKPISDNPLTMSLTEGVTVGDKLKAKDFIRPITHNEAITINKKDNEHTSHGYDFVNRPDITYDSQRGKVSDLYQERKGYTNEVQDEINLLSIKKDNTQIIGSASYAISSRYASDLDLFENVDVCCSKEDAVQVFLTGIQTIVNNVLRTKYHWFIEVKVGLDERYPEYVGHMDKGKYIIDKQFEFIANELIVKNLIYEDEAHVIEHIFSKNKPDQVDFETVMKIMREHRILRWTAEEILSAYKVLPGGSSIGLREAIPQKSQINIEIAAIVEGKLIQVSNFFVLSYHSKKSNKRYVINLPQESVDSIEEFFVNNLKKNIYNLLYSKLKYDPLKAAKRMFSLSRYTSLALGRNDKLGNKVIKLLTSNYALAGQIKSEIGVMLVLLQELRVNNFPSEIVRHQLESYRSIISSFTDMKQQYRAAMLKNITTMVPLFNTYNYLSDEEKALIITLLDEISTILFTYATAGAEKFLKSKHLIPLPKYLQPPAEEKLYH